MKLPSGEGWCSTGGTCSTQTEGMCSGDNALACREGNWIIEASCSLNGLKCLKGKCVGPEEACTSSRCDGDVGVWCIKGFVQRKDCAAFGPDFHCQMNSTGTQPLCVQGTACDLDGSFHKESCAGGVLTVCNAGKVATLSCKDHGFSGCVEHGYGCMP